MKVHIDISELEHKQIKQLFNDTFCGFKDHTYKNNLNETRNGVPQVEKEGMEEIKTCKFYGRLKQLLGSNFSGKRLNCNRIHKS